MANDFQIRISAVDKITATIRGINDRMAKLTRPVDNIRKSMRSLTREAGLDRFGKNLKSVSEKSARVASNIRSIVAPLTAIVGVSTVAGVADLAAQFGRWGNNIQRTASTLGVSTTNLQEFQAAAKMAGLSSDSMTASLKSMGDTLEDATYGRNQEALMMMNRLHIKLHRTKNGAIDSARGLKDLADALQNPAFKGNAQAQALVARTFGVESMLYLLQKGSRGIDDYIRQARKLGLIMSPAQVSAANRYNENMMRFDLTLTNLRNTIGNALMPVLGPLVDKLASWVAKNKDLIASKITNFVQKLADALAHTDWEKFKIGAIAVAGILGAGLAANVLNLALAMGKLAVSMGSVGKVGIAVLPTIAKLAGNAAAFGTQATMVAGAGFVGWEAGKHIVNPLLNYGVNTLTGGKENSLGGWMYDLTHKQGPIGISQNNPGNLRRWGNHIRMNGFAVFKTPGQGITAMAENLRGYQNRYGLNTLRGIISRYAPASENDTSAYIADVSKHTGFGADQRLNLNDARMLAPLVSAMILHENGKNPYTNPQIDSSVQAALREPQKVHVEVSFKNPPVGTRVATKTDKGTSVALRIGHSLHPAS